jgi:succinyl-diaminopimelate desuccinylase
MSDVVQVASDLISRPSPNPPGETVEAARYVDDFLQRAAFSTRRISPDEQAVSIIGEIGNGDGPTVIFHAHLDTVPEGPREFWEVEPYAGTVKDGRLYGRGACDDKGILAAMLCAGERLAARAGEMKGRLIIAGVADEETGGARGTRMLVEQGNFGHPDVVVVGEPTSNKVSIAHKGIVRTHITTLGRSAHATTPWHGVNAIEKMAKVISAIEAYNGRLRRTEHPLLGSSSVTVSLISGGIAPNVVADRCTIDIDRRFMPGENPSQVVDDLQELLRELSVEDPELVCSMSNTRISDSFETEGTDRFTLSLMETAAAVMGQNAGPVGFLPGADARFFKLIPSANVVIFGPGSYEAAHSSAEHVPIDELRQSEEILVRFAEKFLF